MDNTRIVRNKKTGSYVNVDPFLKRAYEYKRPLEATIFNDAVDEMTDVDVVEYVTNSYQGTPVDLEIVPIKVRVDIR